jgi:hypothetical protein
VTLEQKGEPEVTGPEVGTYKHRDFPFRIEVTQDKEGNFHARPSHIPANKEDRKAAFHAALNKLEPLVSKNGITIGPPKSKNVSLKNLHSHLDEFLEIAKERGQTIDTSSYEQVMQERLSQPSKHPPCKTVGDEPAGLEAGLLGKIGQIPVGKTQQQLFDEFRERREAQNNEMGGKKHQAKKDIEAAGDKVLAKSGLGAEAKKPGASQIAASQKQITSQLMSAEKATELEATKREKKETEVVSSLTSVLSPPAPKEIATIMARQILESAKQATTDNNAVRSNDASLSTQSTMAGHR